MKPALEKIGRRQPGTDGDGPSLEQTYQTLANRRRRYALHYFQRAGGRVTLGELAEQVAAWEHGITPEELDSRRRKATYTALQQRHVPKLADIGLVKYDRRAGVVEPTPALSDVRIYTEVVTGRGFPWSHYYVGLSALVAAVAVGVWVGAFPFTRLPTVAWLAFAVVAFASSSLAHAYLTRKSRVGVGDEPPELRHDQLRRDERTAAGSTGEHDADPSRGPGSCETAEKEVDGSGVNDETSDGDRPDGGSAA